MKALIIKGLELPTTEGSFIDIRIQSDGTALLPCGMGMASVYTVEEIELPESKEKGK